MEEAASDTLSKQSKKPPANRIQFGRFSLKSTYWVRQRITTAMNFSPLWIRMNRCGPIEKWHRSGTVHEKWHLPNRLNFFVTP